LKQAKKAYEMARKRFFFVPEEVSKRFERRHDLKRCKIQKKDGTTSLTKYHYGLS